MVVVPAPELSGNPKPCPVCDATVALGLLTSACESADPSVKNKCFDVLKPLENGKGKAADAVSDVLVLLGEDKFNETVERFNLIMFEATAKAKERLIKEGKLNSDGTPKDSGI